MAKSTFYWADPRPTLVHYRQGSLTHPMLTTCVLHIRAEGHREVTNNINCSENQILDKTVIVS